FPVRLQNQTVLCRAPCSPDDFSLFPDALSGNEDCAPQIPPNLTASLTSIWYRKFYCPVHLRQYLHQLKPYSIQPFSSLHNRTDNLTDFLHNGSLFSHSL